MLHISTFCSNSRNDTSHTLTGPFVFCFWHAFYEHCWLYTLPSVHIGKLAHGRVTPGEDLRPRRKFCQDWVINNLTLQTDLTSRILPLQTCPTFISRAGLVERRFTPFSMSSGPIGLTARAHGTNSHPVFYLLSNYTHAFQVFQILRRTRY